MLEGQHQCRLEEEFALVDSRVRDDEGNEQGEVTKPEEVGQRGGRTVRIRVRSYFVR